jgi:hypothetical protein
MRDLSSAVSGAPVNSAGLQVLLGFIAAVTMFAALGSRHVRRGLLERLLGKVTRPAGLVR